MRLATDSSQTQCPYCGETIELVVDLSVAEQEYTEDCFVCCRPMLVSVYADEEAVRVYARREDE